RIPDDRSQAGRDGSTAGEDRRPAERPGARCRRAANSFGLEGGGRNHATGKLAPRGGQRQTLCRRTMRTRDEAISGPELRDASAAELRIAIRSGRWQGPTAGLARGFVQATLVILPQADAADF